jgi:CRP-like cAMP-binding protein
MVKYTNRILAALSRRGTSNNILSNLSPMEMKQRQVLYEVDDTIEYLYFMESGVASVLTTMENGDGIEVGMIGYEGIVGTAPLLGNKFSDQHVIVQLPGEGFKIKTSICKTAFEEDVEFRKITLKFVEAFLNLSSQTAACNRLHSVEQRCARWLLMSSDRLQYNVLPLTQEYLAYMMGVRRSGVSEAAGELQRAGVITYNPGHITIVDREGLKKSACECYGLDRDRFEQLIAIK